MKKHMIKINFKLWDTRKNGCRHFALLHFVYDKNGGCVVIMGLCISVKLW